MYSDGTRKELIKCGIPLHRNTKFRFHSIMVTNKQNHLLPPRQHIVRHVNTL